MKGDTRSLDYSSFNFGGFRDYRVCLFGGDPKNKESSILGFRV